MRSARAFSPLPRRQGQEDELFASAHQRSLEVAAEQGSRRATGRLG